MSNSLLVLNAGSSSLKYALFGRRENLPVLLRGSISSLDHNPQMKIVENCGRAGADIYLAKNSISIGEAMNLVISDLEDRQLSSTIEIVGHRIVHGGTLFSSPALLDDKTLEQLRHMVPLAPMHQPRNLEIVEAVRGIWPKIRQFGWFDTAFHGHRSRLAKLYGLPRELTESGIISYGFHGISYASIASQLASKFGTMAGGRTIVAHLGSGASLCAMHAGVSVATTMGFSPLDGLIMSTRCGSLDPGIILHLIKHCGMDVGEVADLLGNRSGLFGVSGISGDMLTLLDSQDAFAQEAVDLFVYTIAREMGAMTAALRGLDTLVFCAGIGENSPLIREKIGEAADWLGIKIDAQRNWWGEEDISAPSSKVKVLVFRTDEERAVASQIMQFLPETSIPH